MISYAPRREPGESDKPVWIVDRNSAIQVSVAYFGCLERMSRSFFATTATSSAEAMFFSPW